MDAQLSLNFDTNGVRRMTAARPLGPWPLEPDGFTVMVPVVSRFVPGGIAWTMIEAADYSIAMSRWFHVNTRRYVIAHDASGRVQVALHNLIVPPPNGHVVDHIDGNQLDNRRGKLRIATRSQNAANRARPATNGLGLPVRAPFRGVRPHGTRWLAILRQNGKRLYAGSYATPEEAAKAYDTAARERFGAFARTNFQPEIHPMQRTITLKLAEEHRTNLEYREIDADGQPVPACDGLLNTVYLKRAALGDAIPTTISITINTQQAA